MSIGNARLRFDRERHGAGIGECKRLRARINARMVWVSRGLEVTSIFTAITLGNIAVVKIVDALLEAFHH